MIKIYINECPCLSIGDLSPAVFEHIKQFIKQCSGWDCTITQITSDGVEIALNRCAYSDCFHIFSNHCLVFVPDNYRSPFQAYSWQEYGQIKKYENDNRKDVFSMTKTGKCVERSAIVNYPYIYVENIDIEVAKQVHDFVKRHSGLASSIALICSPLEAILKVNTYERVICLYNSGCYLVFNPYEEDIPFRAYTPTTFERKFQETEPQKQVPSFRKYKSAQNHIVNAIQWFENGDHPLDGPAEFEGKVVRYFKDPNIPGTLICGVCGKLISEHGWLDNQQFGGRVCPGDFIITDSMGRTYSNTANLFLSLWKPIEDTFEDVRCIECTQTTNIKYTLKTKFINAIQWFRRGDHPHDSYAEFINTSSVCGICGKLMAEHGWITGINHDGFKVCPGDFIITDSNGVSYACNSTVFLRLFDVLNDMGDSDA